MDHSVTSSRDCYILSTSETSESTETEANTVNMSNATTAADLRVSTGKRISKNTQCSLCSRGLGLGLRLSPSLLRLSIN